MRRVKERNNSERKCAEAFFMLIIVITVLSAFVGIISVGNGSHMVGVAEATQNITSVEGNSGKNFTPKELSESSSQLTITILNESTALGEWFIYVPCELVSYIPLEKNRLEENIDSLEKGMEDLFLQDVRNIEITEGTETLIVNFNLKGNYTNSFISGKCRYTYELTTYAPVGLSLLKIVIPQNKTLVSINPGPNEMKANEMVYHDYNWAYPIEVHYAEERTYAAKIGDVWASQTLLVISKEFFRENENSYFAIPDDWVGWGGSSPHGTPKTAYQIAEEYKPRVTTHVLEVSRNQPPL